jgi:hypothetical protein
MKRLLLFLALAGTVAALAVPAASSAVRVLPLSARPNGWTYLQWYVIYSQRSFERDFRSLHSLFTYRNGQCGQKVGQAKAVLLPFPFEGDVTARCRIEPGTRLVVDVAGAIGFYGRPAQVLAQVEAGWNALLAHSLTLDGRSLTPHVLQTPFVHVRLPHFNAQELGLPQTTVSFIARDYFAILSPIGRGWHTLTMSNTYATPDGPLTATATFLLNVR